MAKSKEKRKVAKEEKVAGESEKPTIRKIAEMYVAAKVGALKEQGIPPEHADSYWRDVITRTLGGEAEAKAALKKELGGGIIYDGKVLSDEKSLDLYAAHLLYAPSDQSVQLQMLDFGISEEYRPVIVKSGETVKYDAKKAVEIAKSRAKTGAKKLAENLKSEYGLNEDLAKSLEGYMAGAYNQHFGTSDIGKLEGDPMKHYFSARGLEMEAEQKIAQTADEFMKPYRLSKYMSVQEAGKTAPKKTK